MRALDRAKDVIRTLRFIPELRAHDAWGRDEIEAHQRKQLRALFEHARRHSSFWRERLPEGADDVTDVPQLEKRTLVDRYDEIVTDPEVKYAGAQAFANDPARATELAFFRERYVVLLTSGSTGQPCMATWDREVAALQAAAAATRLKLPPLRRKYRPCVAELGMTDTRYGSGFGARFMPRLFSDLVQIHADRPLGEIVAELNKHQPDLVSAFSFGLARLLPAKKSGELTVKPSALLGGGEVFPDEVRAALREAFGCSVLNSYGACETGAIALDCRHERLHVIEDVLKLESVDAAGRPVPDGEIGEAVLVTQLYNRIVPVIRYRLEDRVRMGVGPCPCGSKYRWIASIEGRSSFATLFQLDAPGGGKADLVGWKLQLHVAGTEGIRNAQVVFEAPARLRIGVIPSDEAQAAEVSDRVKKRTLEYLGAMKADPQRVAVEVSVIRELAVVQPSGKTFAFRIEKKAS